MCTTEITNMKNNLAFTLVELMIVVALISIMALFAAPQLINWRTNQELRSAAQTFYGNLQLAKVAAVKDNEDTDIKVVATAGCPSGEYTFSNAQTTITGCIAEVNETDGGVRVSDVKISNGLPVDLQFTSRGLVQTSAGVPLVVAIAVTFESSALPDAGDPQYTVTITTAGGISSDKGQIPPSLP